jgi:hypothetical protein
MIAVVGLSATVVILATDEADEPAAPVAAQSAVGASASPAPGTRYDGGPEEGTRGPSSTPAPPAAPGTRYDGGPEEGTRGIVPALPGTRYDGGPEEGTRGPGFSTD